MVIYKLLVTLILCFAPVMAVGGKCRALALSGGGFKGAYEAAVFIEWTNILPKEDIAYDVVGGISVGALNGATLATFKPGDEKIASDYIFSLWNDVTQDDVFTNWPGGLINGLFEQQGIYNDINLKNYFRSVVEDQQIHKKLAIGVSDMNTARYISKRFDETNTTLDDEFFKYVIASTAMPLAFPPELDKDMTLLDGGVVWSLDILDPITRCLEIVDDESDIILDVIMTSMKELPKTDSVNQFNTFEHFMRGREIHQFHKSMANINNTMIAHPRVNFRYLVAPSEDLGGGPLPLDFSKKAINKCFEVGKKDGEASIKLGPKGYWDVLQAYYEQSMKGGRDTFKDMLSQKMSELDDDYQHVSI